MVWVKIMGVHYIWQNTVNKLPGPTKPSCAPAHTHQWLSPQKKDPQIAPRPVIRKVNTVPRVGARRGGQNHRSN